MSAVNSGKWSLGSRLPIEQAPGRMARNHRLSWTWCFVSLSVVRGSGLGDVEKMYEKDICSQRYLIWSTVQEGQDELSFVVRPTLLGTSLHSVSEMARR
jgi:hypothetical protein